MTKLKRFLCMLLLATLLGACATQKSLSIREVDNLVAAAMREERE